MLGDFLEFSIASEPMATAVEFYRSIGFTETPTNDIVSEPYVALRNGAATLGLRATGTADPVPTFVRPELKTYLRGLRRHRIELSLIELADDQFHRIGFEDPNGLAVMLVEARTRAFERVAGHAVSTVGDYLELSVWTDSVRKTQTFWEALGLTQSAAGTEPAPWVRLEGHGFVLGAYEGRSFQPGLTFSSSNLAARYEYLQASGVTVRRSVPFAVPSENGITVEAPGGQWIYVVEKVG